MRANDSARIPNAGASGGANAGPLTVAHLDAIEAWLFAPGSTGWSDAIVGRWQDVATTARLRAPAPELVI